jgi:dynactin-4
MDFLPTVQQLFVHPAVNYECDCGARRPLTLTYFCRYCLQLRCRGCVSKEVDSQYCQHCLEYIPIMDGKLKKNKCATCFQCPSCLHTLSTRSFLEQVSAPDRTDQPPINKKAFTLVCCFCKWSSLDVGIPKQFVGT